MLNVSSLFRNALSQDKRFFLEKFNITLKDGTVLNLTNENVWSGSLSFEDAVSSDSDLQLGAAIINKEAITLNNIYGDYSNYDFLDAVVVTQVGLEIDDEGTPEYIKKGTFTVDSANFDNSLVSLTLLDFMAKFEKPFSEVNVTFPITADALVRALCTHCNVILGTLDFPHKTFSFATGPQKDSCSCREVLSWVAQAVGCFARCNVEGKLELKWFDRDALEQELSGLDGGVFDNKSTTQYVTGDSANGGTFSPWSLGTVYDGGTFVGMRTNVHYIPSTFNHTISVDEVIITGVRILVKTENSSSAIATYMTGTDGYVVEISNNELITASNANTILAWLGPQLIGLTYRKANVSAPSDPSIEAGDVALVWDRKGNSFPILVTKVTFSPGSQQTIVSAAQNPVRNNSARYSVETKNYVATHRAINAEKTARELVEESLRRSIENANGLYQTDVTSSSGTIHYLHSKPLLADSDIRIMISDVGVLMTANGTAETPTWYGLTVDGTLIANILNVIGINADWINTGRLVVGSPSYASILNTTSGMSLIVDEKKDDITTTLTGVDWFVFEGKTATSVYVNSNSWFQFGGSFPSSSGSSSSGELNISRRDGALYKLYRQAGVFNGVNFLKIRYEGYTSYSSTDSQYRLVYELFLWPDNSLLLNLITIPSAYSNRGVSSVVTPSKTTTLTGSLTAAGLYRLYGDSSHTWHVSRMNPSGGETLFVDCDTGVVRIAADLKLGGANNVDGVLEIYDAYGEKIGIWDKDGIQINEGSMDIGDGNFTVSNAGAVVAKSFTANDYIDIQGESTRYSSKIIIPCTGSYDTSGTWTGNTTLDKYGLSFNRTQSSIEYGLQTAFISVGGSSDYNYRLGFSPELYIHAGEHPTYTHISLNLTRGFEYEDIIDAVIKDRAVLNPSTFDVNYYYSSDVSYGLYFHRTSFGIFARSCTVSGDFTVNGTKNRIVDTEDYGSRLLYCYETPTPMFGDIGEGVIGEDGRCFIPIDPTFAETISTAQYQVFLQKYGSGECYVSERKPSYFIVEGTPDLAFGWEIKAKQRGYEQRRLDAQIEDVPAPERYGVNASNYLAELVVDYGEKAIDHIEEINRERTGEGQ